MMLWTYTKMRAIKKITHTFTKAQICPWIWAWGTLSLILAQILPHLHIAKKLGKNNISTKIFDQIQARIYNKILK